MVFCTPSKLLGFTLGCLYTEFILGLYSGVSTRFYNLGLYNRVYKTLNIYTTRHARILVLYLRFLLAVFTL